MRPPKKQFLISWNETDADGTLRRTTLAWPWHGPIASVVATVWGYLPARRRPASA
jgi:hypothetical protein